MTSSVRDDEQSEATSAVACSSACAAQYSARDCAYDGDAGLIATGTCGRPLLS